MLSLLPSDGLSVGRVRHSAFRRGGGDWTTPLRGEEGVGTYKYTGGVEAVSYITTCTHHMILHPYMYDQMIRVM